MSTFFLIILLLASGACFLGGGFFFVTAKSTIHEIEGLILFFMSAVCFVGFAVGAAVLDLKDYFVKKDRKQ
jgi:hypothetical protein